MQLYTLYSIRQVQKPDIYRCMPSIRDRLGFCADIQIILGHICLIVSKTDLKFAFSYDVFLIFLIFSVPSTVVIVFFSIFLKLIR